MYETWVIYFPSQHRNTKRNQQSRLIENRYMLSCKNKSKQIKSHQIKNTVYL